MKAEVSLINVFWPKGEWTPDDLNNTRVVIMEEGDESWNEIESGDDIPPLRRVKKVCFEIPGGYFIGKPVKRFGKTMLEGVWSGKFGSLTGLKSGFLTWEDVALTGTCETSAWVHPISGSVYEAAQWAAEHGAGDILWGNPEHKREVLMELIATLLEARISTGEDVETDPVEIPEFIDPKTTPDEGDGFGMDF